MVYIDNMNAPYRGMKMCHMIADTTDELLTMADAIGVQRKWIQDKGTYNEHFDICATKKAKAIQLGATEVTMMELGRILVKRPGHPLHQIESPSIFDSTKFETKRGPGYSDPVKRGPGYVD